MRPIMAFFGSPRGWRLASSPAAGRCASRRGPGPTAHPPAGPAQIMHRAASRLPPSCAIDRVPAAELEGSGRGSCIPQTPPGRREKPGPSRCAPSSGQCVLEVRLAMCPVCSTRQDRGPGSERHPHHSRPSPPISARSWAAAAANVSPETFGCSLPVSHLPLGPVTGHSASGLQPHPSAPTRRFPPPNSALPRHLSPWVWPRPQTRVGMGVAGPPFTSHSVICSVWLSLLIRPWGPHGPHFSEADTLWGRWSLNTQKSQWTAHGTVCHQPGTTDSEIFAA